MNFTKKYSQSPDPYEDEDLFSFQGYPLRMEIGDQSPFKTSMKGNHNAPHSKAPVAWNDLQSVNYQTFSPSPHSDRVYYEDHPRPQLKSYQRSGFPDFRSKLKPRKVAYNKAGKEVINQFIEEDNHNAKIFRYHRKKVISPDEVQEILHDIDPQIEFEARDEFYCLVDEPILPLGVPELIAKSYKDSDLASKTFKAEKFDCDDFAEAMKVSVTKTNYSIEENKFSLCFGIMTGFKSEDDGHAFNFYINTKGQVRLFEPQTGELDNSLWDYSIARTARL